MRERMRMGLRPKRSDASPIQSEETTLPQAHVEMTTPTVEAVPPIERT